MTDLQTAYDRLFTAYGPQHWWPAETPFEVVVGAILTQNTNWKNVEKALVNLRDAGVMSVQELYALPAEELAELIRPAGYYRLKTRRLRNFLETVVDNFEGSLEMLLGLGKYDLRETLLQVNGIGPETADAITLYAGEHPIFVIDAYTSRVVKRHGWIDFDADYHQMQEMFHTELPDDVAMFNEYHALIVRVGKEHCKTKPNCDECPLRGLLPSSGPLEQEW